MIKLGDEAKDIVTGLQGIVIAETKWLNGCIRYIVQPPMDKDGKVPEPVSVDAPQLVVVKAKAFLFAQADANEGKKPAKSSKSAESPGGPKPVPDRGHHVTR